MHSIENVGTINYGVLLNIHGKNAAKNGNHVRENGGNSKVVIENLWESTFARHQDRLKILVDIYNAVDINYMLIWRENNFYHSHEIVYLS